MYSNNTNMEFPLVTVFTLIYNTDAKFVIEAIESVRFNNYPNIQHIIIDDCSTDLRPKEMVKDWILNQNYVCEFYEHETNFGICGTLNHVLGLAKGKYLFGCCDDLFTSRRIWDDVGIMEELNDDFALIFGMSQEIDKYSQKKFNVFPKLLNIPSDNNFFKLLIKNNFISAPSVTYRTEIIKKIGGFDESYKFEDYPVLLKLAYNGYKFALNPTVNSYYRIHSDSISNKLNFDVEDIRILLLYNNVPFINNEIRTRIISMGIRNSVNYRYSMQLYSKIAKPDISLRLAGIYCHSKFKQLLYKILTNI